MVCCVSLDSDYLFVCNAIIKAVSQSVDEWTFEPSGDEFSSDVSHMDIAQLHALALALLPLMEDNGTISAVSFLQIVIAIMTTNNVFFVCGIAVNLYSQPLCRHHQPYHPVI